MFTVPPGGNGVYYFSTYLLIQDGEYGRFDMVLNDDVICSTYADHATSGATDYASGSCSVIMNVVTGKQCSILYTIRTFWETDFQPNLQFVWIESIFLDFHNFLFR